MASIPGPDGGRPFVAVVPRSRGVYDMTLSAGAMLRDFVDVTASLPTLVFIDHWSATPGGTDVTLRFRSTGQGVGAGGGWVPTPGHPSDLGWSPFQESLAFLLREAPEGPTGVRLRGELLRLDPRSVVALADMVRDRRLLRV